MGAAYQVAASALHKQQSSAGMDSPRRAFQIKTEMQSPLPGTGQVTFACTATCVMIDVTRLNLIVTCDADAVVIMHMSWWCSPVPCLQIFNSSRYQQLASKLVNMVNMMRAAGAQFTLDLPTVVVCGNQSAGKSSLVEGIINIPLPRSDSTCTR
jgi:hypothetical protein